MGLCFKTPADKAKFDKLASVIGFKEAARDFFEQDGRVRTPQTVIDKLNERLVSLNTNPSIIENLATVLNEPASNQIAEFNPEDLINSIVQERNALVGIAAADNFASRLGVPYEIISEMEAINMGYPDAKGLFYRGKVYLVDGKFTADTLFHEFAHPVIKAMSVDNLELMDKLYQDLLKEDYGADIVNSMMNDSYYGKSVDTPQFKEEAIVRALTQLNNEGAVADNRSWLGKVLFQIKQFLRKMLGRSINVSKLSTNTSLNDIVDMLNVGDKFEFDREFLSKDDFVMLEKEFDINVNALREKALSKIQSMTNAYYDMIKKVIGMIQDEEQAWVNFGIDITNEENTGDLQVLLRTLQSIASTADTPKSVLTKRLSDLNLQEERDALLAAERVKAFINAIASADAIFDSVEKKITQMESLQKMDNIDMANFFAISQFIDHWASFIQANSRDIRRLDYLFEDTQFHDEFGEFEDRVKDLSDKAIDIRNTALTEILYDHIKKEHAETEKFYQDELARLKKKGLMREYKKVFLEYHNLTVDEYNDYLALKGKKERGEELQSTGSAQGEDARLERYENLLTSGHSVTKDIVRKMIEQGGPDASWMNSMWNTYNENQDKLVGGFYSYLTDFINEVNFNAKGRESDFLEKLNEKLSKTKFKYERHLGEGRLGVELGREINVGNQKKNFKAVDEFGNPEYTYDYEDQTEWQFLSNFKGHEAAIQEMNIKIKQLKVQYLYYPTKANEDAYYNALETQEDFLLDYMHQDNVPAFYEAKKILRGPLGRKARQQLDMFYEEVNTMGTIQAAAIGGDRQSMQAIKEKWQEHKYLHSIYDRTGKLKTGEDLEISKKLIEYRDAMRDFYEWSHIDGAFQAAYDAKIKELSETLDANGNLEYPPGSIKFQHALNDWIEANTIVENSESWFEERKALIEEQAKLLEPLRESNNDLYNLEPLYEKLSALLSPSRNEQGIYDGNSVSVDVQKQIREVHIIIEQAKMELTTMSGLTKLESNKFTQMALDYEARGNVWENQEQENAFRELEQKRNDGLGRLGIHPNDVARIFEISKQLEGFGRSEFTDSYIDTFTQLALSNSLTEDVFYRMGDAMGLDFAAGDRLESKHLEIFFKDFSLQEKYLTPLRDNNLEFKEWFDNNHYDAERMVVENGEFMIADAPVATNLWKFTQAPSNYKNAFAINDIDGNLVGPLKVNGEFRVPNFNYRKRDVKEEFTTKVIDRDYVDPTTGELVLATRTNKGHWLPRDYKGVDAQGNPVDDGAATARFIQPEYKQMFNEDRNMWDVLEHTKNHYLDLQKDLPLHHRMYLAYPTVRKGGIENKTRKGFLFSRGQGSGWNNFVGGRVVQSLLNLFRKQSDDIEIGMSQKMEQDVFDNTYRPITGTYKNIPSNEISTNIIKSIGLFGHSVETYRKVKEVNAVGRSLEQATRTTAKDNWLNQLRSKAKFVRMIAGSKSTSKRADAISNILDRYMEGIALRGENFPGKKFLAQVMAFLSGANSRKWFAGNYQSTLTNTISGKTQAGLLSVDKRFPNPLEMAIGEAKATVALGQIGWYTYTAKQKPASVQFLEIMDASPDRLLSVIGDSGSRNIAQDVFKGQIFYVGRRNAQLQFELQGFYGILEKSKYKFQLNNAGKKITLDKAIMLENGRVVTKPGTPKEFSISYDSNGDVVLGDKIKEIIKLQKAFLSKTVGMSGSQNASEIVDRSLLGKYNFHLFRWFIPLAMQRYQFRYRRGIMSRRFNWQTKSVEYGYVIGAMDTMRKAFNTGFRDVNRADFVGATQVLLWWLARQLTYLLAGSIVFNAGDDEDEDQRFTDYDPDAEGVNQMLTNVTALPKIPYLPDGSMSDVPYERYKNALEFKKNKGYWKNPEDEAFVRNVDQADWQPIASERREGAFANFDAPDYWKLIALRTLIRQDREWNSLSPWATKFSGGGLPIVQSLAGGRSALTGGAYEDYWNLGVVGYNEFFGNPDDNIIKTTGGPYVWQQKGVNKIYKWLPDYLGIIGSNVDISRGIKNETLVK
jgi:hypothetical protein